MCIDIYSEYNVDINKLTRDYQKFPVQIVPRKNHGGTQYDRIPKEDFVYLYIECNLPRKVLEEYLHVSKDYIKKLGRLYNVKKSFNQWLENSKKTNLQKYGVEHPLQSPVIVKKMKQTCLQNYGVESYSQTDEFKEKCKETCLDRYGVENYTQTDEFKNLYKDEEFVKQMKQKEYETKKKNGSFGKSEEEEEIYNLLLTKFKDVKRQYHSDLYPFPCDFYIPEKDLYIEYQGYFTHGNEPYLGTDEQKEIIKEWENESQTKTQYLQAIKTWTDRDPLKRDTAKQNNLNWIEFFNMNEFMKWFENN